MRSELNFPTQRRRFDLVWLPIGVDGRADFSARVAEASMAGGLWLLEWLHLGFRSWTRPWFRDFRWYL